MLGQKIFCLLSPLLSVSCCAASLPDTEKANFELWISEEQIQQRLKEVAHQIDEDYAGKELVIVMVMKGAICLTADLIRHLHIPCSLEFVQAKSYSYGANGAQRGTLSVLGLEHLAITGKDILLVDDILDSGTTLSTIAGKLQEKSPNSVRTLVLLSKNIARKVPMTPDYVLFDIEDRFVLGYGLDYKEYCRGLPGIYFVHH